MHFSSPSHPLVYAFLLQKEAFSDMRKVIVENQEQGEKLLEALWTLRKMTDDGDKRKSSATPSACYSKGDPLTSPLQEGAYNYRLISSLVDLAEFEHDTSIIGIFTPETLHWQIDPKNMENYSFKLEKGMKCSEDLLIHWLSDHGYVAKKSDEIGTYFRVGDTISIPVGQGILRVSFFGRTIEAIFLGGDEKDQFFLYSQTEEHEKSR